MATRNLLDMCSILLLLKILNAINAKTQPCDLRQTDYGSVCVCNANYCDYLDAPHVNQETDFILVSSTKEGLRFSTSSGKFNSEKTYIIKDHKTDNIKNISSRGKFEAIALLVEKTTAFLELSSDSQTEHIITRYVSLSINRTKQYQKIVGFGGSFTGSVSHLLQQYPEKLQDHIYRSFYAENGLGFNLMSITIGGSDFDLRPWAYNEQPENDKNLTNFTKLHEVDIVRVAQIKRLQKVANIRNLRIKGAAWSAPTWMKTNKQWTGFGRLHKQYFQTWADYHLKWLELMDKHELPIWAISTGNEPLNGIFLMFFVHFMSMSWTPQKQAIWLSDNLGPTIRNSKYSKIMIFGNDDQSYTFPYWLQVMNQTRPNSVDYLDGFAMHWYWDDVFGSGNVNKTMEIFADKIWITSESCIGDKPWQKSAPLLGSWERGEKYARAFLQNLRNGFHGWIDWNIILDESGGPNYVNNYVDAPIIANTSTYEEFYKQPIFYAMGHFAKFVPEGSVRIDSIASNINIETVAFQRPDGSITAILFNSGRAPVEVTIFDTIRGGVRLTVPAKSIHSLIYK